MFRSLVASALAACLVAPLASSRCDAGVLNLAGQTTSTKAAYDLKAWTLSLVFTPNPAGPAATIASATLTIDGTSFLLDTASDPKTVTVTPDVGLNDDRLYINANFLSSGAFGTNTAVLVDMVVAGKVDISPALATDANIQALAVPGNLVKSGTFVLNPSIGGGTALISFTGAVVTPEPGSVALLGGLGLVLSIRWLRRRSQTQA
ncbi:MAG: PEP-CTERM sorting domain-containing protein [Planctomycetaceae bacterium]